MPDRPEPVVEPAHSPLQIATKIHFALLRELGQGIDVGQMLKQPRYARDVLLVCDACRGSELAALSEQFRGAIAATLTRGGRAISSGATAHPIDWAADSSGFGVSRPMDLVGAKPPSQRPRATR